MSQISSLDRIENNLIEKYVESNIYNNALDCKRTFDDFLYRIEIGDNQCVVHNFKIKITGTNSQRLSEIYFQHEFTIIIGKNKEIMYCDFYPYVHDYSCRKRLFTIEELKRFVHNIFDSVDLGFFPDLEIMNDFLNDDDKTNWTDDYDSFINLGKKAIPYDIDYLISLPELEDLISKIKITSYEEVNF